ncbi:unnamed protein product [Microthlaspi erraticum]|uniref:Protein kinase domain-containing protein n=1 Tax=Microthlaspi erraticum TaxID=1685480 RepID=A0A6D2IWC9_9BRAS|nr:unnamed protein product [Microthlaspi erraticum]
MKRFFCCLKGEGSRQGEQAPPGQREPPHSPENVNNENDDVDEAHPFGSNEFLNYARRNNIEPPDDRLPRNSTQKNRQALSPLLLLKCGITFPWTDIVAGTQDFSRENYLGQGNFGNVYRCDFPEFDKVGAAKVQKLGNASAHKEFVAEITVLEDANHPNVIQLLGKCFGKDHSVIVYEFMPKGSLDHHIYANTKPGPGLPQEYAVLDWETRMSIAVGVAEALNYLHGTLRVIHRDVKVANVLLDENFVPKLTDFGLASQMVTGRYGGERQIEISPIKGTPGCVAPETEESGLVSSKSDVYSYGIFLLTLFTGRKACDFRRPSDTWKIADWMKPVWSRQENIPLVVDVALGPRYSRDGLVRLFETARRCINVQARDRPPMSQVLPLVRYAAAQPLGKVSKMKRSRSR